MASYFCRIFAVDVHKYYNKGFLQAICYISFIITYNVVVNSVPTLLLNYKCLSI
nr:MAG TPA: hypothetical protein [Caudoviricetes sp.]